MVPRTLVAVLIGTLCALSARGDPVDCNDPDVRCITWDSNAPDITAALQDAVDDPNCSYIYLEPDPNDACPGMIDGRIDLASGKQIVLGPGTVLESVTDSLPTNQSMFLARHKKNIGFRGADPNNPGVLRIPYSCDFTPPEDGLSPCLDFRGCRYVTVQDLRFVNVGRGDGLHIGPPDANVPSWQYPSYLITVSDCVFDNCWRWGIAVTSARSLTISGCMLNGDDDPNAVYPTNRQGGIDLEPDRANADLYDINIVDCVASYNHCNGFGVQLGNITDSGRPIDVNFTDCTVENSWGNCFYVGRRCSNPPSPGVVQVDGLTCTDSMGWGLYADWACFDPNDATKVVFNSCDFENVTQTYSWASSLRLLSLVKAVEPSDPITPPDPNDGGFEFYNCTIVDSKAVPALEVAFKPECDPNSAVVSYGTCLYVRGDITYIDPNGTELDPNKALPNLDITISE